MDNLDKKLTRVAALERQTERLNRRLTKLGAISDRYSWLRLGIFGVTASLSILTFWQIGGLWGWGIIAVGLVVFEVVARFHSRLAKSILRHRTWLNLKTVEIARARLDWANLPPAAVLPPRSDHPFELDLDLTGHRSIHHLLDTATSQEGSARLADWLLDTHPDLTNTRQRQNLVRELAPLSLFRNRLKLSAVVTSNETGTRLEARKLLKWFSPQSVYRSLTPTLLVLFGLTVVNLTLAVLSARFGVFPFWLFTVLLYMWIFLSRAREVAAVFDDAYILRDGLRTLSGVLGYLETYPYGRNENLRRLCQPFLNRQARPSAQLRRISLVAGAVMLRKNAVLWLLVNIIVPWDLFFAHRLNQSRAEVADLLPGWLEAWFELEALSSLAGFAYLNPHYTLPQVTTVPPGAVLFQAQSLGHPLIPDAQKVCNDYAVNTWGQIDIVTGSNMAGKSSFLRTLGVNLCLAYAGGPVNAAALHTSLFRVFTCIKVSDSVNDGYSYFYAEVRRLKALLNELERPDALPLFFLIDEIFRGTNNRERLIGSRAYLHALVGSNGVGIVSTHDLELIHLADENSRLIHNFHFREEVVDGRMVFDYRLRPGPSPTTNALKIMRMEGLPVELPNEARLG